MIDELANEIAAHTPLDADQAKQVLAGALSLIQKHAHGEKVEALLAAIPGASELAASAPALGSDGGSGGGFLGGLISGVMKEAGGGAMADGMGMLQQLSKSGIASSDIQKALPVAVQWVQAHAGSDLLGEALASIPGAGGLLSRG